MELLQLLVFILFFLYSSLIPNLHDPLESHWIVEILAAYYIVFVVIRSQLPKYRESLLSIFPLGFGEQEDLVCTFNKFFLLGPKLGNCLDLLLNSLVFETQDNNFML
jgi:hypothetical protein